MSKECAQIIIIIIVLFLFQIFFGAARVPC